MNRILLFRGRMADSIFNKKNYPSCSGGEWVYGYYVKSRNYHYILQRYNDSGFDERWESGEWVEVDEKTVGQWIGLYDKDVNPIYEGDIMDYGGKDGKKEVVFSGGSFGVLTRSEQGASFGSYRIDDGVVVGNIYENPELLKS